MMAISRRTRDKIIAVSALVLAAFAADRLTHIPTAAPISDDGNWAVRGGGEVVLTGVEQAELLGIQTASGDGITVEAGPVRMADGRLAKKLEWVVSGQPGATDDNKVAIQISLEKPWAASNISLKRLGTKSDQRLQLQTHGTDLAVSGHVVFGDLRVMPPTNLTIDNVRVDQPLPGVDFSLLRGGTITFGLASYADIKKSSLIVQATSVDSENPRLWLQRASYWPEGAINEKMVVCAALPGSSLWQTILRRSNIPLNSDCHASHRLAVSSIEIKPDRFELAFVGSAYSYDRDKPVLTRWFQAAKDNPVGGVLIGLLLAALGGWIKKTFTAA